MRTTNDDDIAALVDAIPGFGGMYVESGVLTVYLKDTLLGNSARPELERFLGRRVSGNRAPGLLRAKERVARMKVRKAKYDFRELLGYYRGHLAPAAMLYDGVIMTDIDDRANKVVVGVLRQSDVEPVRARLRSLPVPDEALSVEVVAANGVQSAPTALLPMTPSTNCASDQLYQSTCRSVPGGAYVEYYVSSEPFNCSIGFNVVAWTSGAYGSDRYFITNSHCGTRSAAYSSFHMGQATVSDSGGQEVADPEWLTVTELGSQCPYPRVCRYSDAALFRYQNAAFSDQGRVALPAVNSGTGFSDLVTIAGVTTPLVGDTIYKVGSVTGRQGGLVTNDCANSNVVINGQPTGIWMLCQGIHSAWGLGGDSGGAIVELIGGGEAYAVGLHWGSAGAFSKMNYVLYELYNDENAVGILDPRYNPSSQPSAPTLSDAPPGLTASISGPSTVHSSQFACVWQAVVSGGSPSSYSWSGVLSGSSSSIYGPVSQSGYLYLTVEDGNAGWISAELYVTVDDNGPGCE